MNGILDSHAGQHAHDPGWAMPALVARLNAEARDGYWVASCPAHDDAGQSLRIRQGHDGKVTLFCEDGCESRTVLAAVGLTETDLEPNRNGQRPKPVEAKPAKAIKPAAADRKTTKEPARRADPATEAAKFLAASGKSGHSRPRRMPTDMSC